MVCLLAQFFFYGDAQEAKSKLLKGAKEAEIKSLSMLLKTNEPVKKKCVLMKGDLH